MSELSWQNFILAFIPLFVAMDAAGAVPFYLSLTATLDPRAKRRVITQSILTAGGVGILFLFVGNGLLAFLGITLVDFKIAGGIVLLVLAVLDLVQVELTKRDLTKTMGVVPLGMPLIVGPAVLTSLLILTGTYGPLTTILAFGMNLLIVTGAFLVSGPFTKLFGEGGTRAISKVTALLLAAYAVMMIRSGVQSLLR